MIAIEAQQSQEKLNQFPGIETVESKAKGKEYQKAAAKGLEAEYGKIKINSKEKTENKERPAEYLPQTIFINKTKEIIGSPIPDIPENSINILRDKGINLDQSEIKEMIEKIMNIKETTNDEEQSANEEKVKELQNIVQYFYPIDAKTGEMKKSSMDGDFGPNVGLGIMNMLGTSQEKIMQYKIEIQTTITDNNAKFDKPPFKRCDEQE